MSKSLPASGFKELDSAKFNLDKYDDNISKNCVFEIDFEYPKELQELQNNYLLAPDKLGIKIEWLSDDELKIADDHNVFVGNVKKLVPNFFNKEKKYVFHYKSFQFFLKLGLEIKKAHRVFEFNQSKWLKPHIEFNPQKRTEAEQNDVKDGKTFNKLMNNAIYSKTIENLGKKVGIRLANIEKGYLEWTSKPNFKTRKNI